MLQQIPAGVLLAEAPSGRIVFENERAGEILRKAVPPGHAFEGSTPFHLLRTSLMKALHQQKTISGEVRRFPREDGSWLTLRLNAVPLRDATGTVVAAMVAFEKITQRQHVAAALQETKETLEAHVEAQAAALQEKDESLRRLASALTRAEQLERRRIARLLHDDLQQLLFSIEVTLTQLRRHTESSEQQALLDQIEEIAGQALDATRTLSVELYPPGLQEDGLKKALRWLAAHVEDLHGLSVDVEMKGKCEVASQELRVLLFQCVRELLFNVAKHAGIDRARVEAQEAEGYLTLRVIDEGAGFDPEELEQQEGSEGRLGLSGMRKRLGFLGAWIEIESAPGEGTRTTIVVPQPPPPAGE